MEDLSLDECADHFAIQNNNDEMQQGYWRKGDYGLNTDPKALKVKEDLNKYL